MCAFGQQTEDAPVHRLRIAIQGAVQGVGFRPFVFRLAGELGLTGWVINDSRGVFLEVEGSQTQLERFLARLPLEKPPHARIVTLESTWLPANGYDRFEIRHSDHEGAKTALVLPDLATCPDCLADVFDAENRRYGYPFTNCTNCGPRFSIVQALPYDRPNTTMARFELCPACRAEYEDPLDRRFHAQPNACPYCGPQPAYYVPVSHSAPTADTPDHPAHWPQRHGDWALRCVGDDALVAAVAALAAGQIIAAKGLGGFHLLVDAGNDAALGRLRARKPRRHRAFALMVRDLAQARQLCEISDDAEDLLRSAEAPIVLLPRRADAPVSSAVAPGNPNLGIMLPYTPLHHLLLRATGFPLVATSGNLTDEPICTDEWEAMERLGHIADAFLVHDRPIARHVDDTVLWIVAGQRQFLRRARGYAPLPVQVAHPLPTILAVGAHLKNTVALSVGRQVFLSQHIGDLETAAALEAFERVIADFLRLYEATPDAIAHDMHPEYLSTQWVGERQAASPPGAGEPVVVPVQHHHAHLAACLAENEEDGPALGVIWDGTGYGPDGTVWGGEFLFGDASKCTRVGRLRPFHLPGGDAAIKEPRRAAFALLWAVYGDAIVAWDHLAPIQALTERERHLLAQMLRRGFNSPTTTSAGRLFDGVAALLGLHQQVSFEGQAAMALEFAGQPGETAAYPLGLREIHAPDPLIELDWRPLLEAILTDLRQGQDVGIMASRVHNALVDGIAQVAERIGHPCLALSGGCFQNRRLTEQAIHRLRAADFEVLLHRQVPPNDGGISLGQVAVAAARLQHERQ